MKPTDPKLNEVAKAFSNVEQPLADHAFILGDICGRSATTGGPSIAVEHRFIGELAHGMQEDGLRVQ